MLSPKSWRDMRIAKAVAKCPHMSRRSSTLLYGKEHYSPVSIEMVDGTATGNMAQIAEAIRLIPQKCHDDSCS